ncbi:MAG TPA: hypothetical protein VE422_20770 [Terriglobia bacterium]|nr:hypothetical protein [Terriglobia bacterium]
MDRRSAPSDPRPELIERAGGLEQIARDVREQGQLDGVSGAGEQKDLMVSGATAKWEFEYAGGQADAGVDRAELAQCEALLEKIEPRIRQYEAEVLQEKPSPLTFDPAKTLWIAATAGLAGTILTHTFGFSLNLLLGVLFAGAAIYAGTFALPGRFRRIKVDRRRHQVYVKYCRMTRQLEKQHDKAIHRCRLNEAAIDSKMHRGRSLREYLESVYGTAFHRGNRAIELAHQTEKN